MGISKVHAWPFARGPEVSTADPRSSTEPSKETVSWTDWSSVPGRSVPVRVVIARGTIACSGTASSRAIGTEMLPGQNELVP